MDSLSTLYKNDNKLEKQNFSLTALVNIPLLCLASFSEESMFLGLSIAGICLILSYHCNAKLYFIDLYCCLANFALSSLSILVQGLTINASLQTQYILCSTGSQQCRPTKSQHNIAFYSVYLFRLSSFEFHVRSLNEFANSSWFTNWLSAYIERIFFF